MANGRKTSTKSGQAKKKTGQVKKNTVQTKKNTSQVKKNTVQTGKEYIPTEKDIKIRNEIELLVSLAITVLLMLSNFGLLSPVGDYLAYFMFGLFGFLAYVFPIVLFVGIAFLISNIDNRKGIVKFTAGVVLFMLFCALIQLIFMDNNADTGIGAYYRICGSEKTGGGLIGAAIQKSLDSVIGTIGTYFVLVLLIIIALIIITEKSFIGGVRDSSAKVYNTAKTDVEKIRESTINRNKEKEYRKKQRINKKVKGVRIQKLEDGREINEDIHEIVDIHEKMPEYAQVYRGHVDMEEIKPKESAGRQESLNLHGNIYEPQSNVDEDGLFKPKEQIVVSEEAKAAMTRKPFDYSGVGSVEAKATTKESPKASDAGSNVKKREYILPSTELLKKGIRKNNATEEIELHNVAKNLEIILENFGVKASVTDYNRGPSVTRYEIQPETGTRLSKITSLADDIKLNLAATDIRIEPIPGKSTIGIEVPNKGRDAVLLRDLIESRELSANKSMLAFPAGMDIAGNVVLGDIAKMPHLLVAGTTGSGKSVFTNSIIMSILFRATPDDVRFIIVDPKVVEFGVYNGIPHLLQPVVTDPKKASNTLKWAVAEMSERYKKFADFNVRDLKGYNEKIRGMKAENGEKPEKLPQILIVIDELADLMMVAAKEVEESICRLAQLARAAGIHLIIATQRPSVDVVTGLIKANIPSRCALMVSSGVDSRTIIDSNGAEKLLGNGDMLFYPSGYVKPVRLQGAFVSDAEVQKVVNFWKEQAGNVTYDDRIEEYVSSQPGQTDTGNDSEDGRDEYFYDAARFVIKKENASISMIQRMFKVGFNRAARIVDQLYEAGVVGDEEGKKPRRVLMTLEEFEAKFND